MIAGGYDKGVPFTQLGVEMTKKVKTLILCGATAPAIRKAVEEAPGYAECGIEIVETQELGEAVAEKGESVAVREARKQIALYISSFRGAAAIRARINRAESYGEVREALLDAALHEE